MLSSMISKRTGEPSVHRWAPGISVTRRSRSPRLPTGDLNITFLITTERLFSTGIVSPSSSRTAAKSPLIAWWAVATD
jgi:hypothetical protein